MGRQAGGAVQDGRVTLVRTAGPADVEAVSRLEDECLGVDAWSEGLVREGIDGALPTVVYLVAEVDDEVVGHAVVSTAGDIAELQRIAVACRTPSERCRLGPARRGAGGCRPHRGRPAPARGPRGQPGSARVLRQQRVHRDRPATPVLRRRRHRGGAATGGNSGHGHNGAVTTSSTSAPLVLGIETSCDETGVGIVRGHTLLADAVASSVEEHARFGGVVPEVASRAHLEAMVPTIQRACATAGVSLKRRRRDRRDRRPGAGRRAAGRCRRREVAGPRPRQAAVRREPPRRARGRRPARARSAAGPVPGDARLRWPLLAAAGGRRDRIRSSRWGPPSTTPRARPSTRSPGSWACRSRAARTSTTPPLSGSSVAIDFPRGLSSRRDLERHRFDFSFSGLKTAVARWVQALRGLRRPGAGRRRRRVVPGGGVRRAHPQGGRRCRRPRGSRTSSSAAASQRTRGCASWPRSGRPRQGIRVRVPRPGLCTDNGAMVAALGAEMVVPRPGRRPALDLPADSSMPVEQVLAV